MIEEPSAVIDVTDLHVALGGQMILHGVNLAVRTGEVVALLGANGSGKSTLIKTLVGINPIESGHVRLFGSPMDRHVDWRRIGYVPQRVSAGSGVPATAAEVVAAGLLYRHRLRPPRRARDRVVKALDLVGLAERADYPVNILSGGQQQRVLIARALVREPSLLFLDEPVAGVDLPSQRVFVDTLKQLHDAGTTIVVVLHEIGSFANLIERAVVLRQGAVIHDGQPPKPSPEHAGEDHDHVHPHEDAPPELAESPDFTFPTPEQEPTR